jgi:hypothetical protein
MATTHVATTLHTSSSSSSQALKATLVVLHSPQLQLAAVEVCMCHVCVCVCVHDANGTVLEGMMDQQAGQGYSLHRYGSDRSRAELRPPAATGQ